MTPPTSVTVRVPAKVNLELRVGRTRADGYHDLSTVFMAVGIFDEVTVSLAPSWSLTVEGLHADRVPTDETNLALRAARSLARDIGDPSAMAIHIHKDIPVAGGMAGGSADAAAALIAADRLLDSACERDEFMELAAELGSDVPFGIAGGIAVGSGRGEQLAPVLARGSFHWVFALSEGGLSTPEVFAEYDRMLAGRRRTAPVPSTEIMAALRQGDALALGAALNNDLEPAAFGLRPELADVLAVGRSAGALGSVISGSGPTCAFLAATSEHAIDLAVALSASGLVAEVKRAKGPVHGAQVVATSTDGPRVLG